MSTATTYTDKQGNQVSLDELLKGKTPDQVRALKFFHGIPVSEGCLKKGYMSEADYMQLVNRKQGESGLKQRALSKLGIDEDQVREIDPVCFQGFRFEFNKLHPYTSFMSMPVSSMFETTWLFFGDEQVYVYNHAFDTTDETLVDTTQEYFYGDITAFATRSDSVQSKVWVVKSEGCTSSRVSAMKNVTTELFRIVVPGEVFECAFRDDGSAAKQVAAMKQKLREKKQR